MKITERIQGLSEYYYTRLNAVWYDHQCDREIEWSWYSRTTIAKIRPIFNALVKFERETGAKVTTSDLDDIRAEMFYSEATALFIAVMDNVTRGLDVTGHTVYNRLNKSWVDCFEGFQNMLRGLSIRYGVFNYSDTNGLDSLSVK